MQITIAKFEKTANTKTGKLYSRIQTSEGNWLNVSGVNLANDVGREIEISEPSQLGQGWWAFFQAYQDKPKPSLAPTTQTKAQEPPKQPAPTPGRANGGGIAWADYIRVIRAVHAVAMELEPEVEGGIPDRSQARAAICNTLAIALTNGRV